MSARMIAAVTALSLFAAPAFAQDVDGAPVEGPPIPADLDVGNMVTVSLGAAYGPDYEGSDEYRFIPGAFVRADLGDISIVTRGLKVYADVLPNRDGPGLQLDGGPIAGVRLTRTGDVDDERVDALPELKTAIEVGGYLGLSYKGLTNPYDKLSLRVDAVKDINGAHSDWVFTPVLDFSTPLSLKTFASVSASMDIVGDDFADTYFGIAPDEVPLHPELTAYDPDGGIKSWSLGLLVGQSLEETLLEGWSLFGTVNYKRLVGDAADSPLVADFGTPTQWFVAAGLGYTF